MENLQYIGARYVPKFFLNPDDQSNDWKAGVDYEALTIVTYNNDSYTSKKVVPDSIGNPADNPLYWACTTKYTAALQALQTTVGQNTSDITTLFQMYENISFIFTSVAMMKAEETLKKNDIVFTLGYENLNDQGNGVYIITDTEPADFYEVLENGLYAELIIDKYVNVRSIGAKGNGIVDDTDEIQQAIDYAQLHNKKVYIPAGEYVVSRPLRITDRVEIFGEEIPPVNWKPQGGLSTIKYRSNDVEACIIVAPATVTTWDDDADKGTVNEVTISNIKIDGNNTTREACGIVIQGSCITLKNCSIYNFNLGIFIKHSFVINLNDVYSKGNICLYVYRPAALVKIDGGWYTSYRPEEQLPSTIWTLIPGSSEFENYNTGMIVHSTRVLSLEDVAIEHSNYGIQLSYTAHIRATKLNIEDMLKGGIKISDPPEVQATLSGDYATVDLQDANFFNSTYEAGFYWFIPNTSYYWSINANLMQYVNSACMYNVNNINNNIIGGSYNVRRGNNYFGTPASVPDGIFKDHYAGITSGIVNTSCRPDDGEFIIDINMFKVQVGDTTGDVILNVPIKKTFSNGTWTRDSGFKIFGTALDTVNDTMYVAFIDDAGKLRVIDPNSNTSRIVKYEELPNFFSINLHGRFWNYRSY